MTIRDAQPIGDDAWGGLRMAASGVTSHLGAVYAGMAINGVISAVAVVIAARVLGAGGYGLLAIYSVIASLLSVLDFAVGKGLLRRLAAGMDQRQRIADLQTAFALYLLIATALLLALPALAAVTPRALFPVSGSEVWLVRAIVAIAVLEFALAIPAGLVQTHAASHEYFRRYGWWIVVSGFTRNVALIAGAVLTRSAIVTVLLVALRRLIDAAVAPRLLGGLPSGAWRPRVTAEALASWTSDSGGLALIQALQLTTMAAGAVLMNRTYGLETLGVYRVQFDLASKLWMISTGVTIVGFPRLRRLWMANRGALHGNAAALLRASWTFYTVLGVAAAFLLSPLARTSLGAAADAPLLMLLVIGVVMSAHATFSSELLQASGRDRVLVVAQMLALTVLVAVFIALRRPLGPLAIGAAWAASQLLFSTIVDAAAIAAVDLRRRENAALLGYKTVLLLVAAAILALSLTLPR